MNQKSLLCIVVLSIMLIAANGLKIAHKQEETVEQSSAFTKYEAWIAENQTYSEADKNQEEISPEDAAQVKQYFVENPDILDSLIFQDDQDVISCKNELSDQLNQKLDQKFLDKMDFTKIFIKKGQETLTNDQYQSIFNDIASDESLSDFVTCVNSKAPAQQQEQNE